MAVMHLSWSPLSRVLPHACTSQWLPVGLRGTASAAGHSQWLGHFHAARMSKRIDNTRPRCTSRPQHLQSLPVRRLRSHLPHYTISASGGAGTPFGTVAAAKSLYCREITPGTSKHVRSRNSSDSHASMGREESEMYMIQAQCHHDLVPMPCHSTMLNQPEEWPYFWFMQLQSASPSSEPANRLLRWPFGCG